MLCDGVVCVCVCVCLRVPVRVRCRCRATKGARITGQALERHSSGTALLVLLLLLHLSGAVSTGSHSVALGQRSVAWPWRFGEHSGNPHPVLAHPQQARPLAQRMQRILIFAFQLHSTPHGAFSALLSVKRAPTFGGL